MNKTKKLRKKKKGFLSDFIAKGPLPMYFLATYAILQTLGLLMLFSASYASSYIESQDSYAVVTNQFIWTMLGVVAMLVISRIDYHAYERWIYPGYGVVIVLLLVVQFTCDPLNYAKRWLYWEGVTFIPTIQVSEIAKFIMILLTAIMLCKQFNANKRNSQLKLKPVLFLAAFVPFIALLPILLLLFFQPHYSAMVILVAVMGTMVLLSGALGRLTLPLIGIAATAAVIVLPLLAQVERVQERLEGWTLDVSQMGWQTMQSVYAIGSGGLNGLGFGNGIQKQLWMPEATNDFIFSVICEELGFIGATIVILLFVALIAQGFVIAFEAADYFGSLIAIGITAQIAWQFFFNIGVVTGILPNTGISLPFFSSGGTSLLMLLAQMGVMLSIARMGSHKKILQREKEKAQAKETQQQKTENFVTV